MSDCTNCTQSIEIKQLRNEFNELKGIVSSHGSSINDNDKNNLLILQELKYIRTDITEMKESQKSAKEIKPVTISVVAAIVGAAAGTAIPNILSVMFR